MKSLLSTVKNLKQKYVMLNVAVKASLWFAFCSIIQKGISVVTLPIFTRIMSTQQYGEYSVFLTWFNILTIITTLNIQLDIFNKGLVDHSENQDEYTANQAGLLIALTVFFGAVYLIFQGPLNRFMGLRTEIVLIALVEILAHAILSLWSARKRFSFEYGKIVKVTLLSSVMNPVLGIAAVLLSEDKTTARILSNAAVAVAIAIVLVALISRQGKLFHNIKWWKPVILASIPLLPHYLSLVLLNQSDKLMIDYFVGPEQAAIYSVAHSAGLLMIIVNNSINGSFVPWAYGKIKAGSGKDIKKVSTSLLAIVLVVNLYAIWLAPEVIKLLAAPQYAEAIWCLVPIAMSVFFSFAYTLFVDVEIYYGANGFVAIASLVAAGLNLILNYIFIPKFGYIAAGYTTLASYFATMVMHYIFMKCAMKKNGCKDKFFDVTAIGALSVCLAALSALAMFLYPYTLIRIVLIVVVTAILFVKRQAIIALFKQMKNK